MRLDHICQKPLSPAVLDSAASSSLSDDEKEDADDDSDSDDDDDEWTDSWLVTGCSDSSLRKWDFSTGRALERMGTDKIRGERTLVWAVGVLGWV